MTYLLEKQWEAKLRKKPWLIPFITLLTVSSLYAGWLLCLRTFEQGHWWVLFLSPFLTHAQLIIMVHDASHRAITQSSWDDWIMNIGGALFFVPFYGELFRYYHLLHHSYTNADLDPLWPEQKAKLFRWNRQVFVLTELIPIASTLIALFMGKAKRQKEKLKGYKINYLRIAISILFSIALGFILKPAFWFVLLNLLGASFLAKIRNWCEHTGTEDKESNTYWFPLGMGVGNHAAHHAQPQISWLSLMISLWNKPRDTHPLKTLSRMFWDAKWRHYQARN